MNSFRTSCVICDCNEKCAVQFCGSLAYIPLCSCFPVVLQYYEVQVYYNKNVIRGNTAVLKCTIPSFVREYITVTSWVQDSKFNIYPTTKGGKLSLLHSILCQHDLFNHFTSPLLTSTFSHRQYSS